jgi:hypothetical protein
MIPIYGPFDKMWINRVLPLFKMERIATEKHGDGALPHINNLVSINLQYRFEGKKIILFFEGAI